MGYVYSSDSMWKWKSYRNIHTTRVHMEMKLWMKMPSRAAHFTTLPPQAHIKWKLHIFCCSFIHIMTTINSHKYVYSNNVNISCPAFARFLCVVRPLPLQYSALHRLLCSCGPRLKTGEIYALYRTDSRCLWRPNHMANLVPCMQHEMLLDFHAQSLFRTAIWNCDHGQQHNKKRCVVAV